MKQVLLAPGGVLVEDVPDPVVEPGTVLVHVHWSCVSVGTELAGIRRVETPLWRQVAAQPEKFAQALRLARDEGPGELRERVRRRADLRQEVGYSVSGTVAATGAGVRDLAVGDRVACAGAGVANHAELVIVPENLAVRVPEPTALEDAAAVALGAIALQGVRRASPTIGEVFVVVGLGALGQLAVQILRANGCRVIATDIDPRRVAVAEGLGAATGVCGNGDDLAATVSRLTDGYGADAVVITASTASNDLVNESFQMCRSKARVVVVGDVGLQLERTALYAKEIDFLISTSYGPGRYDRRYEDDGLEYPIGYVRWSERRNMAEVIRLMGSGSIAVSSLVGGKFPIAEAAKAYDLLRSDERPVMVLLQVTPAAHGAPVTTTVKTLGPKSSRVGTGSVRLGLIGPGAFAQSTLLPALHRLEGVELTGIAGRSGPRATSVARQWGFAYATTDVDRIIGDERTEAVVIATRHRDHAELVVRALRAGKHVFVEKPLATDWQGLSEIEEQVEANVAGQGKSGHVAIVLTGFNRRFAPLAVRLRKGLERRVGPLVVVYTVNAEYLPADHWVHGPEGAGRNIGEACHMYDFCSFLTGARLTSVHASAAHPRTAHYLSSDNFSATLTFSDGSLTTVVYTALGSARHAKEHVAVFCDGAVWELEDYRSLSLCADNGQQEWRGPQDKGHREELAAFVRGIRTGTWPVPFSEQVLATRAALEVEERLAGPSPQR